MADLFNFTLIICAVMFVIITFGIFYLVFKYRAGHGDDRPPKQIHGHQALEITWTMIPVVIVIVLLVYSWRVMALGYPDHGAAGAKEAPDITIIGHQWWWEGRYKSQTPGQPGVITADEFHIPVGKPMKLRLKSDDVLHGFWVPELAQQMDNIPGEPKDIWLEGDKIGVYQGFCSEYCGTEHARMFFKVYVDSQADFDKWEKAQLEPAPAPITASEIKGQQLFTSMTCISCHAINGVPKATARIAPDLTHLASRETLAAGSVLNTRENLTRWLHNPQDIKPGCYMPDFKLTNEQVNELVDYFETLK